MNHFYKAHHPYALWEGKGQKRGQFNHQQNYIIQLFNKK